MSQTIAQRKALAARTAQTPTAAGQGVPLDEPNTASRHFEPVSVRALRALQALQKTGAELIRVERGTVLLRRGGDVGAIDPSGRVRWRSVEGGGRDGPAGTPPDPR